MFRGSSVLTLDGKSRLAIPSRYREPLAARCNNALVLTVFPRDPCLLLYPLPDWEEVAAKLADLPDFDRQSLQTKRIMRGSAIDCELDSQSRILIPDKLKRYAGLQKKVVFVGQTNRFEIWDEDTWDMQISELRQATQEAPSENLRGLSL